MIPKPIIEFMYEGGCEKSHPIVFESMGDEYNDFGEECNSSKQKKERKFLWGEEQN
jgi:hypothetical protein